MMLQKWWLYPRSQAQKVVNGAKSCERTRKYFREIKKISSRVPIARSRIHFSLLSTNCREKRKKSTYLYYQISFFYWEKLYVAGTKCREICDDLFSRQFVRTTIFARDFFRPWRFLHHLRWLINCFITIMPKHDYSRFGSIMTCQYLFLGTEIKSEVYEV